MNGFWLMVKHEYLKKVRARGFLIATLAVPLVMVLIMGVVVLINVNGGSARAIGFVDPAGWIDLSAAPSEAERYTQLIAYPDLATAQQGLQSETVRAVYVIATDYPESGSLEIYLGASEPNQTMRAEFDQLLRGSLIKHLPGSPAAQSIFSPQLTILSLDGGREFNENSFINFILPFVAGFAFVFVVIMTAGTLLHVVAEEKESRTIEILITTIRPEQLIGGKAVGLMAVCLTQITIWFLAAAVALAIGAQFFEPLREARMPWEMLATLFVFFVPSYALVAALMAAIGGAAGEMRQGQQVAGLVNMLFLLPLFLSSMLVMEPNGPVALFFTFFPPTAFAAVALRWAFISIPTWQLVVSWVLLTTCALLSMLAAARVFRLGMLMYGKGLSLRAAVNSITAGRAARRNADA